MFPFWFSCSSTALCASSRFVSCALMLCVCHKKHVVKCHEVSKCITCILNFRNQAKLLAPIALLFVFLFRVCTNGVIPCLKLCTALAGCHRTAPIMQMPVSLDGFCATCGAIIRCQAAKFRAAFSDEDRFRVMMAKAIVKFISLTKVSNIYLIL